ncbi:MAG: TadE/TadG family type IV pilus assembly protein [Erythrobacter sp.]|jgi:hypothetical protein|nr:TadE/TadG family type IV pilus assembly protein [Erythrobacter sp.]
MRALVAFWRDRRAASAAEFVLVLPAALLLLFGIIDVGNYAWTLNEYEKATQMGARFAVVTDVVSPALATQSYVGSELCGTALRPGDRICPEALGVLECSSSACVCAIAPCPAGGTPNATAFNNIVAHMQRFQSEIVPEDVRIEYRGSGLGYAGDPNPPEIAPLVTVRIVNARYTPIVLSPFGTGVPLPDFSYSLTLEDGEGATSS